MLNLGRILGPAMRLGLAKGAIRFEYCGFRFGYLRGPPT
jgi:hypothetical protein